jgi:fatty acid CoA ligase FadD9
LASTERFHSAVQSAGIGSDKDIPHITAAIIVKYATSLQLLGLLDDADPSTLFQTARED